MKKIKIEASFLATMVVLALGFTGCSTDRVKNQAKERAARYWQEKAYPGKAYDVQVIEAEKADNGMWRVKGIVDGETRSGLFNPETESFNEGLYGLSQERGRKIAELEQEVKYWKEKAESFEKEIFKLKVKMGATGPKSSEKTSESGE
jgi:hypothetical protein